MASVKTSEIAEIIVSCNVILLFVVMDTNCQQTEVYSIDKNKENRNNSINSGCN